MGYRLKYQWILWNKLPSFAYQCFAVSDIRQGVEPQLVEQERTLQQELDTIEKRRVELFSGNYTPQQATAIEQEREQLLSQYQEPLVRMGIVRT